MKKLGFVIANEIEEFLSEFIDTEEYTGAVWSPFPILAKLYSNSEEAFRVSCMIHSPYKRWVCLLLETESQLIVTVAGDDVPSWI